MIPRATATVDLTAIEHNLHQVRRLAPGSKLMAVIKADAYGHGAVPVARALQGRVDAFAVACLEEALVLREAGIRAPLVLLEGILSQDEAAQALRHDLQLVVHEDWQLKILEALPADARVSLWIKLDSGMHRLGFPPGDIWDVWRRIQVQRGWRFQGWMTHLACADEPDKDTTHRQAVDFNKALQGLPGLRSLANSAAVIHWPETHADWVRPGLMLYGASPLPGKTGTDLGLRPAMTLESRLMAVRACAQGDAIGYGATYRCPEAMRVGIVSIGYADGFHRSVPTGTPVIVQGQRTSLVGRVSMDLIAVDLRPVPQARVGDPVLLWGDGLPIEDIAARAGTVPYELLCGLTRRVKFVYTNRGI
ncbi:MAG: alanine racemase [Nevskiales bacterium]|nr:alanine racemase [Nevskiales bacterium]